jgi:tRNA nucleotidyltransferase/poly(A) polymerase
MPDYIFMLESRLTTEQRAVLSQMQSLAAAEGINLYLTGGAVRDLITGAPIRDLDFTVEGNPARLVRELEKGGTRILEQNETLRHYELLFPGDIEGSVAAAREEVYERPGAKPEIRWSTVIEDLRRRDFSVNSIGLSLAPASRGLLLDPTNGLADIEKREMRILSMHGFTNQPVRLLRILRFASRLGFQIESRTADWMALAFERNLHHSIPPAEIGREVRELAGEENPIATLKDWGKAGLLGLIHPKLAKRTASFDRLASLIKAKEMINSTGLRADVAVPVLAVMFGRISKRELSGVLTKLHFRAREIDRVVNLDDEARKVIKILCSRKTAKPGDTYAYLETVPLDLLAYILSEYSNAQALGKVKNYLFKWKPLRFQLPYAELDSLGVPCGPEYDRIIEAFFQQQLLGKARHPQDRIPLLRKLAGIKPEKPKPAADKARETKKQRGKAQSQPSDSSGEHPGKEPAPQEQLAKAGPAEKKSQPAPHPESDEKRRQTKKPDLPKRAKRGRKR